MDRKKLAASRLAIAVTIILSIWIEPAGIGEITNANAAQAKAGPPAALVDLSVPALAISPDGKQIALVLRSGDKPQLHLRSVEARESKPVPGTEGAGTPLFSPDGKWIAFFADGKLKKVAVDSGQIVTLCDGAPTARGALMVAEIRTRPAFAAAKPRLLFEGGYEGPVSSRANFDISPDGRRFLMLQAAGQREASAEIKIVPNWFEEVRRRALIQTS